MCYRRTKLFPILESDKGKSSRGSQKQFTQNFHFISSCQLLQKLVTARRGPECGNNYSCVGKEKLLYLDWRLNVALFLLLHEQNGQRPSNRDATSTKTRTRAFGNNEISVACLKNFVRLPFVCWCCLDHFVTLHQHQTTNQHPFYNTFLQNG